MSAYVEVFVQGGCRAFIAASNIAGVLTAKDQTGMDPATAEKPMSLLLTSGETLAGVYGISPNRLLVHVEGAKAILRKSGRIMVCAYIESREEFEAEIASIIGA